MRMACYADSSFLVSCYVADANAAQARDYLSRTGAPLIFTSLHELEVGNAFELGVFRGHFTTTEARAAAKNLAGDLRAARLVKTNLNWPAAFRLAARLSEQHSATVGTRSLDILHIAAARLLRATAFVSFDSRQRTLAGAVGLPIES
jgi:predicted nucleic acid-binding protein